MTPVVRRKDDSIQLNRLAPAGFRILSVIDQAALLCKTSLRITCGTEGHAPTDPHTLGQAVDIGATEFPPPLVMALHDALSRLLGPAFTVLYECPTRPGDPVLRQIAYVNPTATAPHFHCQPVKGTTWPPDVATSATVVSA